MAVKLKKKREKKEEPDPTQRDLDRDPDIDKMGPDWRKLLAMCRKDLSTNRIGPVCLVGNHWGIA